MLRPWERHAQTEGMWKGRGFERHGFNRLFAYSEVQLPGEVSIGPREYFGARYSNYDSPEYVNLAGRGVLKRFLRLADATDTEIANFAEKFGLLGLCHFHGLPYMHNPKLRVLPSAPSDCGPMSPNTAEWFAHWRYYARHGKAMIRAATALHKDERAPAECWNVLLNPDREIKTWEDPALCNWWPGEEEMREAKAREQAIWREYHQQHGPSDRVEVRPAELQITLPEPGTKPAPFLEYRKQQFYRIEGMPGESGESYQEHVRRAELSASAEFERRRSELDSVESERLELSRILNVWLELGNVRLLYRWEAGSPSAELQPVEPLGRFIFGYLARDLAFVLMKREGFAVCVHCGAPYEPKRRPAADRRNFCPECREAGVPQQYAKRDYRARKRAARQES